MDLIGDTSRTLNDLYLASFDQEALEAVGGNEANYGRFVDDLFLGCPSLTQGRAVVSRLERSLEEVGLKLNAAKTRVLSRADFAFYWGVDIRSCFEEMRVDDGLRILRDRIEDPRFGRADTYLKWALWLCVIQSDLHQWGLWVAEQIRARDLTQTLTAFQLSSLARISGQPLADATHAIAKEIGHSSATKPKLEYLQALIILHQQAGLPSGDALALAEAISVGGSAHLGKDNCWERGSDRLRLSLCAA